MSETRGQTSGRNFFFFFLTALPIDGCWGQILARSQSSILEKEFVKLTSLEKSLVWSSFPPVVIPCGFNSTWEVALGRNEALVCDLNCLL